MLHSKRGDVTEEKFIELKLNLELTRLKWEEMSLSCTPKLQTLRENVSDLLLGMSSFMAWDRAQLSAVIKLTLGAMLELEA